VLIYVSIGNGINTATAPVWQCETAPVKWRGKLVILEMATNVGGYCLVNWINYGMASSTGSIQWRLPLALQYIFIVYLFISTPWLPESPRWLIAHGKEEKAVQILADLENMEIDDPYVLAQHHEILAGVQYEREHAIRWRDLARGKTEKGTKTIRRLILGIASQAMQQFGKLHSGLTIRDEY